MEALLADKKWRRKNSLWVLLSVLPLLGGLAFFHIGYKARRRNWTLLGTAFTVVWAAYPVIRFFCAAFMDSSGYWLFCNGTELYPLAVVPLSLAGLIGALLLRKNYSALGGGGVNRDYKHNKIIFINKVTAKPFIGFLCVYSFCDFIL